MTEQETSSLGSVNPHYLSELEQLSEKRSVLVSDDIYDDTGKIKLLAKGSKISKTHRERLLMCKLLKPLEHSVIPEDSVTIDKVMSLIRQNLDESNPVMRIASSHVNEVLAVLPNIPLPNSIATLLTLYEANRPAEFCHTVCVAALAGAIGVRFRLDKNDLMALVTAGLIHDIGELYIDPASFTSPAKTLDFSAWKNIAVHPKIGSILVNELTKYPKSVSTTIAEHHERCDGSGYPKQSKSKNLSRLGNILSLTETICGIMSRGSAPITRAFMAIKLIPEETDMEIVSELINMRRDSGVLNDETMPDIDISALVERAGRIRETLYKSIDDCAQYEVKSTPSSYEEAVKVATLRTATLHKALISSGVGECLSPSFLSSVRDDHLACFELSVISREIEWRLRAIGRDVYLRSDDCHDEEKILLREFAEKFTVS